MRADERRPAGAASEADGPESSLAAAAVGGPDDTFPTLAAMTRHARCIALAYFESGRVEGIAAGRRQVEAELAAEWAALRAEVMPRIAGPSYADLAERRGMHDAAERQRQILRSRGIAS